MCNPLFRDNARCHENVAAASEKVREVTENPVAAAVKKALEGPINDFLISL